MILVRLRVAATVGGVEFGLYLATGPEPKQGLYLPCATRDEAEAAIASLTRTGAVRLPDNRINSEDET